MERNNLRGKGKDERKVPDSSLPPPPSGTSSQAPRPRSIQDTRLGQQSQAAIQNLWGNYKKVLKTSWERMPRFDQEALITRLCQIITMGVSILVLMFFYGFLPKVIAIFAVPGVIIASYFAGTKIVAPIIAAQYDQYLNKEF